MSFKLDLATERLNLSALRLEDAQDFLAGLNDYSILKMVGSWPYPLTMDYVTTRFQAVVRKAHSTDFVLTIRNGSALVGTIGAYQLQDEGEDAWSIGFMSAMTFWGQGLMTEAVQAVCQHVAAIQEAPDIMADVFVENVASMRVLEKCGFIRQGEPEYGWSEARQEESLCHKFWLRPNRKKPS